MRYLSPIGAYRIVVIHDKTVPDPVSGLTRTVEPGYTVEFRQGLLTPFERELARGLHYPGGVRDRRNLDGSPYDPSQIAGLFDSEWIEDPDLRKQVEEKLEQVQGFGRPDNFIKVEQPRTPAPWESYDRLTVNGRRTAAHVAEKNLEIASMTGVPIEQLVAYERENRNDSKIIEAYEQAATPASEPEEELVRA